MQTPSEDEIVKLPAHKDRKDYPFAGRPAMPSSRKCPVDSEACFNHYCRMAGGGCIRQMPTGGYCNKYHDQRFVNHDLIGVITIVIATAVCGMLIGWFFIQ